MSAYDADRYAPTSVAVLLQLPESSARAFAVASALGRILDQQGTSDRVRNGKDAAGTRIDKYRLPVVLDALAISERQWRRYLAGWEAAFTAHRCGKGRVFLFARPLPEMCSGCDTEVIYDHVPAPPRPRRGRGFGRSASASVAVVRPKSGAVTATSVAQERPLSRTDASHHQTGINGMEVGVEAPTTEQGEIGIGLQELQEGVLKNRAPACEACGHAHWTLGACREPACGCEVIPDAS